VPYGLNKGVIGISTGPDNTCLIKQDLVDMQHYLAVKMKGEANEDMKTIYRNEVKKLYSNSNISEMGNYIIYQDYIDDFQS